MPKPSPPSRDDLRAGVARLRDLLVSSVTLTTDRLQEAVDDAVKRGRLTRRDAEELLSTLVAQGRRQSEALLADLERIVGRLPVRPGRSERASAPSAQPAPKPAASKADEFPIPDYDELTAAEITKRLAHLTPEQLRLVRDREQSGAARKTVLKAVERRLK